MHPLILGTVGLGVLAQNLLTQSRLGTIEKEQARLRHAPTPSPNAVAVGFTSPTVLDDKLRSIDLAADTLNQDVLQNVTPASGYFGAWRAWHLQWKAFFEKNFHSFPLLGTDALDRQIEDQRTQFNSFHDSYPLQRTPVGTPVPPPSGPAAPRAPIEGGGGSGTGGGSSSGVPWYVWTLGGMALVGVGYLGYLQYQRFQRTKEFVRREVLPKYVGADLARAADVARDPELAAGSSPLRMEQYTKPVYEGAAYPRYFPGDMSREEASQRLATLERRTTR